MNRLLNSRKFSQFLTNSHNLEQLKDRSLIRISGSGVSEYLQGLITNDINHLNNGPGSMYAMFLNTKGRVLYDTIIYKNEEQDTFLLECDREGMDKLQKHLKMYRVRRKIDVVPIDDDYKVYVIFDLNQIDLSDETKSMGLIAPCDQLNNSSPKTSGRFYKNLQIFKDPRIHNLGYRVVTNNIDPIKEIADLNENPDLNKNYRWFRYSLGVGEGIKDLPIETSFPLECNCDYLHGVSFHKGCYIGQELTARVHHTGVVRKRLMPIKFKKIPSKIDENIVHEGINLGKLRGIENDVGLGLLRMEKVLNLNEFNVSNGTGYTFKPKWWPLEAPKEKVIMKDGATA